MDIRKVKKLIEMLEDSNLNEIEIKEGEESVKLVKSFYKIDTSNIFVFHDELDLDIGKIKFKFGGGSAGHNGIKNIDKHIGNNYYRIRIGVNNKNTYSEVDKFVLSDFEIDEKTLINNKIDLIDKNINYVLKKDLNIN